MSPLMEQFINEAKDILQSVSDFLIKLEDSPDDKDIIDELFRLVHTLKGSSGIFEELVHITDMLHAVEDLMDCIREGKLKFDSFKTDAILEAMDLVSIVVDSLEESENFDTSINEKAQQIKSSIRGIIDKDEENNELKEENSNQDIQLFESLSEDIFENLPEDILKRDSILISYQPEEECFFKGDDPVLLVKTTPGLIWAKIWKRPIDNPDIYKCFLNFVVISDADLNEVEEHFAYVSDQVKIEKIRIRKNIPDELFDILEAQKQVLSLAEGENFSGKVKAVANVLSNIVLQFKEDSFTELDTLKEKVIETKDVSPLLSFIDKLSFQLKGKEERSLKKEEKEKSEEKEEKRVEKSESEFEKNKKIISEQKTKIKTLKVDTSKIDRLMNLVAEMVIAKNSLIYLAKKAEEVYNAVELSKEIQDKYSVFDRLVEEMQDSISELRMMPVGIIFQRFPRLVRDISKKLGKKVELKIVGEETEADKNVIEALSEPLIHLIRNSLDHGIELPEERRKKGKPETGKIIISASQEADHVLIQVEDDGRGIDLETVKLKAYKKGLIDEEALEKMDDKKAINLIFSPGFSTADSVSEISGRGVGMDVVKNSIEKLGGSISIETEKNKGTKIKLSLPLSMAVTKVMILESADQMFGIPMDIIVESVRVPFYSIKKVQHQDVAVLRGEIIPLYSLNELLGIAKEQKRNEDNELAVLVLKIENTKIGLVVDAFKGTMDVILKPFQGIMASMPYYAGSAILGDGSVLLILNPKEFWHAS